MVEDGCIQSKTWRKDGTLAMSRSGLLYCYEYDEAGLQKFKSDSKLKFKLAYTAKFFSAFVSVLSIFLVSNGETV